ncbi:RNA 2',3'-cyclic phosphodiesterase [Vibrio parahaemolyticus]
MRLFFAITLMPSDKDKLISVQEQVKKVTRKGRYTNAFNFHITLAFLGEVHELQVNSLLSILSELTLIPTHFRASRVGYFGHPSHAIVHLKVEKDDSLMALQAQLNQALLQQGFPVEKRAYVPHITLGRNLCLLDKGCLGSIRGEAPESPASYPVKSVALMESKLTDTGVRYEVVSEVLVSQ